MYILGGSNSFVPIILKCISCEKKVLVIAAATHPTHGWLFPKKLHFIIYVKSGSHKLSKFFTTFFPLLVRRVVCTYTKHSSVVRQTAFLLVWKSLWIVCYKSDKNKNAVILGSHPDSQEQVKSIRILECV